MKTKKQKYRQGIIDFIPFSIHTCAFEFMNISIPNSFLSTFQSMFRQKNNKIHLTQIADNEFKRRLTTFVDYYKNNYRLAPLFKFLNSIPENEYFFVLPIQIDGNNLTHILECYKEICKKNHYKVAYSPNESLLNSYLPFIFGKDRCYIGERDKEKRICRFCGKSYPQVTFKKVAHAFSENLGNKKVINCEECDSCNMSFSKMEQSFSNLLAINLILFQIKGKEGFRDYKGQSINIDNSNVGVGRITLMPNEKTPEYWNESFINLKIDDFKYIPRLAYKCLVKFALSVVEKNYLSSLSKTIEWVCSDCYSAQLPPLWIATTESLNEEPILIIFYRKIEEDKLPRIFVKFHTTNMSFLYLIPLMDETIDFDFFETNISTWFNEKYSKTNFTSCELQKVNIDFTVDIESFRQADKFRCTENELISNET